MNTRSNEKWKNPAVREENAHLDFKGAKLVYTAEHLDTVLDSDITLGYLKKRYREKSHVVFYQLNTLTGLKTQISVD